MRTHGGSAAIVGAPGPQDAPELTEQALQIGRLLLQQPADVDAWWRPGSPERDDMRNLRECQTQPTRAPDEDEEIDGIRRVDPISGGCAAWRRQDASRFVEPQRLPPYPAFGR